MGDAPVDVVDRHKGGLTVVEIDADRCDACPAEAKVQAYVYAELPSGGTVSLCGHHGHAATPRLIELGATIVDLRHLIPPARNRPAHIIHVWRSSSATEGYRWRCSCGDGNDKTTGYVAQSSCEQAANTHISEYGGERA